MMLSNITLEKESSKCHTELKVEFDIMNESVKKLQNQKFVAFEKLDE